MIWALSLYALFLLTCVWSTSSRCGTVANPVSFFVALFGLQTLVAPAVLSLLGLLNSHSYQESDVNKAVGLSALYVGSISAAFLFRPSPFVGILRALLPRKAFRITAVATLVSYVQVIVMFAVLMYASSAGTLWFTNPRLAYQTYRDGAGVWWSLCQASLIVAFGCALYKKRLALGSVLLILTPFAAVAYFLGSKGLVLSYLVLGVFYADNVGCRIGKRALSAFAIAAVLGILSLQIIQGTATTVSASVEYFDYFTNTTMFLSDFGRLFEHTHGRTLLSEMWFYVPRALYRAKPYAYGGMQIMAAYYPGAAELGSTPGILPWAASYLDFGAVGVAMDGLVTGLVARGAFDLFRKCANVWSFLLFAQVGLMAAPLAFCNAPFPIFTVWLGAQWAMFRIAAALESSVLVLPPQPRLVPLNPD